MATQAVAAPVPSSSGAPPHVSRPPTNHRAERPTFTNNNKFDKYKIVVTGYPAMTQKSDLVHAFLRVGPVQILRINQKSAILCFTTEQDTKCAVALDKQIIVYGEFLGVRHFRPQDDNTTNGPRQYTLSKIKSTIVEPDKLDLSGTFYEQMERALSHIRLTQDQVCALGALYNDIEQVMRSQWPGSQAMPFGSITTGLGVRSSDADCFVSVPPEYHHLGPHLVIKAKKLLMQYPQTFAEIVSIPRANTPIVKFYHIPTETNCDLSFKTLLGVQNSKLIAFLLHADPRLVPMAVLIKYWAKVHEISGTGKLTNYALTMMIIFYLQQPPVSILPPTEKLQRDRANDFIVDFWNTGFLNDRQSLPLHNNTSSISELLGGFFSYYSKFNFEEMVISPFLGTPIKKEVFRDLDALPKEFERYKVNVKDNYVMPLRFSTPICIQDPIEQCHNVGAAITSKLAADIVAYFKFATNAFENDRQNGCRNLLKTILLHKPKLNRGKPPEYKVKIYPRVIATIKNPDWQSVVRQIVNTVFEQMLKSKLVKVEEKDKQTDAKKVKEKYTASIAAPVWRRKQHSKMYFSSNLKFVDKQARITEDIIKTDPERINFEYQLILLYYLDPRSIIISIKFINGDRGAFREFGNFFVAVLHNWFMNLMNPYGAVPVADTAADIAETIKYLDSNLQRNEEDSDDSQNSN